MLFWNLLMEVQELVAQGVLWNLLVDGLESIERLVPLCSIVWSLVVALSWIFGVDVRETMARLLPMNPGMISGNVFLK